MYVYIFIYSKDACNDLEPEDYLLSALVQPGRALRPR